MIIKGKYTTSKIFIDTIDEATISQITKMVNNSAFTNPIKIMPDTHAGKGSVIGFTMKLTNKVIPSVIGVDLGCGMRTINVGAKLLSNFTKEEIDNKIRSVVPMGFTLNNNTNLSIKDFPYIKANDILKTFIQKYKTEFGKTIPITHYNTHYFERLVKKIETTTPKVINSVGTLGGGNHFIEIGKGKYGNYWITAHTGSRNFGLRVCKYHQHRAEKNIEDLKKNHNKKLIDEVKEKYKNEPHKIAKEIQKVKSNKFVVCPKDLSYLEDEQAYEYFIDMLFIQVYAEWNREVILNRIKSVLNIDTVFDEIESVHNFIDFEDMTIRKGAIRSYEGEEMIIPFNMRDGILLCEGKSNSEWNYSAPHGAGRIHSRSDAKRKFTLEEFEKKMNGIYSTSICKETIDESPMAYKNANVIENAIEPTAHIKNRLKVIINLKSK